MINVVGAQGNIQDVDSFLKQVLSFAQKHHVVIQVFDANMVYGKNHLISAVEHAIRAMKRKTNATNSTNMEILLYASGERQIKTALPKMGVKKGESVIAFVFVDELYNIESVNGKISDFEISDFISKLGLVMDDHVLEGDEKVLRNFGVSDEELSTVMKAKYGDLILERVALVDIIK
jgi:KEOPS complex subunit Cgi121